MSFITSPGVVGFSNLQNTTAPNSAVPVSYFIGSSGSSANVDVAIGPKGSGSIMATIPDNTAAGGNKRGPFAVDWQVSRTNANQIALGQASVIAGGVQNRNEGTRGFIGGGLGNFIGNGGGDCVIAGGNANTSGVLSFTTIGGGNGNSLTAGSSTIPGGQFATDRGVFGAFNYSSSNGFGLGIAQMGMYTPRNLTTNAVATVLFQDQGTSGRITLPDNSLYTFSAIISGHSAANDNASFKIEGAVSRGAGVATTAIVGALVITPLANSGGVAVTWLATAVANVAFGSLDFTVTGSAALNVRWSALAFTAEVTGFGF